MDATTTYTYDPFGGRVKTSGGTGRGQECIFDVANTCFAEVDPMTAGWLRSDVEALGQTGDTETFDGKVIRHSESGDCQ